MRIVRWCAHLLCLTYDILYRPGSVHFIADCLLHHPLHSDDNPVPVTEPVALLPTVCYPLCYPQVLPTVLNALSVALFSTECATCPELCALQSQIEKALK